MNKNILVTGATGHFGKAAIGFLLQKGIPSGSITALVRNEEKAKDLKSQGITLKIGDYDDYDSLLKAFKDVDKLLFVSATDINNRGKQHQNVVKAAQKAGVAHIFYTSFVRKNETTTSPLAVLAKAHMDTEAAIKASGMKYTIFRNNLYMDVLPLFMGEKVLETGIFLPAGETGAAYVTRKDMAEAAANAIATEGHENVDYEISNTENYTFQDVADILSRITQKNITYTSPDQKTFTSVLADAGVPSEGIDLTAGFAEAIKQGEFTSSKTDLTDLLGRKPMTLEAFLKESYSL